MYETSFALQNIGSVNAYRISYREYNLGECPVKARREWIPRLFEVFV